MFEHTSMKLNVCSSFPHHAVCLIYLALHRYLHTYLPIPGIYVYPSVALIGRLPSTELLFHRYPHTVCTPHNGCYVWTFSYPIPSNAGSIPLNYSLSENLLPLKLYISHGASRGVFGSCESQITCIVFFKEYYSLISIRYQ